MTGERHFLEAEEWLAEAQRCDFTKVPDALAMAQVHATLALVAAVRTATDPSEGRS